MQFFIPKLNQYLVLYKVCLFDVFHTGYSFFCVMVLIESLLCANHCVVAGEHQRQTKEQLSQYNKDYKESSVW